MRTSRAVPRLVLVLFPATAAFADEDSATRIGASRGAIKPFAGALQGQLSIAVHPVIERNASLMNRPR